MGGPAYRRCTACKVKLASRKKAGKRRDDVFMCAFPKDENRCREWVRAVGDTDLVDVPMEKLHQLRHICSRHFQTKDFNRLRNRLNKSAIPTVDMKAVPLTDEQLKGFPLYIYEKTRIEAQKREKERAVALADNLKKQSSTKAEKVKELKKLREHGENYDAYIKVVEDDEEDLVEKEKETDDTVLYMMEVTDESDDAEAEDETGDVGEYRMVSDSESSHSSPARDTDVESKTTNHLAAERLKEIIEASDDKVIAGELEAQNSCQRFCDNFALTAMRFSPILAMELQAQVSFLLKKIMIKIAERRPS